MLLYFYSLFCMAHQEPEVFYCPIIQNQILLTPLIHLPPLHNTGNQHGHDEQDEQDKLGDQVDQNDQDDQVYKYYQGDQYIKTQNNSTQHERNRTQFKRNSKQLDKNLRQFNTVIDNMRGTQDNSRANLRQCRKLKKIQG